MSTGKASADESHRRQPSAGEAECTSAEAVLQGLHFVDVAFNLTDLMYKGVYNGKKKHDGDLLDVLRKAVMKGADKILATGVDLESSKETIDFIRSVCKRETAVQEGQIDPSGSLQSLVVGGENVFTTVGVHPTNTQEFLKYSSTDLLLEELKKLVNANRDVVRAYGEFGLDRARTSYCSFDIQQKYFEPQLQLAEYLDLPLFLHNRDASDLFYLILKRHPGALKKGGVVHSFDGDLADVAELEALGLHIGVNGCSMKTERSFEAIKKCRALHLETDAPWCQIKNAHSSFPLLEWTKMADIVNTRNDRHVPPTLADDSSPNGCPNSRPRSPLTLVKGRNEPCLVAQVAEATFKIRHPEEEWTVDHFRSYCDDIYAESVRLFNL